VKGDRCVAVIHNEPKVVTEMLIKRPVEEVFEAFIDPAITTKFWFTKSSGRLEPDAQVKWEWEMYGASTNVMVKEIVKNKLILIEWGEPNDLTTVEWTFRVRKDHTTLVTITNKGFQGTGDEVVSQALDSMGGFTMILCSLKALLEFNVLLNVVADKAPDAHIPG